MPLLALKPVLPKHMASGKEYTAVIKKAAQKSIKLANQDYKATARTYKRVKPEFDITEEETSDAYTLTTGTDDKVYGFIDEGTKPHIIHPRRSKYLRFKVGGIPKTRVGIIGSQAGRPGTDWRTANFVLHPGTQARKFTLTIQKRRQKTLEQEISHGIAKVVESQR